MHVADSRTILRRCPRHVSYVVLPAEWCLVRVLEYSTHLSSSTLCFSPDQRLLLVVEPLDTAGVEELVRQGGVIQRTQTAGDRHAGDQSSIPRTTSEGVPIADGGSDEPRRWYVETWRSQAPRASLPVQQVYCTGGTRRRRGWLLLARLMPQRLSSATSAQMLLPLALTQFFSLASGGSPVSFVRALKERPCVRARWDLPVGCRRFRFFPQRAEKHAHDVVAATPRGLLPRPLFAHRITAALLHGSFTRAHPKTRREERRGDAFQPCSLKWLVTERTL
ncbi:hypothetical protein MRX96_023654 [Rhipicephalus microplus]